MRTILITGSSGGIGRATALAFAQSENQIAVHYSTNAGAAHEVVDEIRSVGCSAYAFAADLREQNASVKLVNEVCRRFGAIEILVNNAGLMTDHAVQAMPDEIWDESVEVNLSAAFRLSREVIPKMIEAKWGRIISVSSQVAETGSQNHAHYAAAKAGLAGLTFSLAKELGPAGITANIVAPGRIMTEMIKERSLGRSQEWLAQTPLQRFGTPEEVADAIVFLASEKAGYITGLVLNVNGGLVMG